MLPFFNKYVINSYLDLCSRPSPEQGSSLPFLEKNEQTPIYSIDFQQLRNLASGLVSNQYSFINLSKA